MRKAIDGLIYDTTTASEVGYASRGARNDFGYWVETLYRTPRGRWFIAGEGGAASQWARPADGGGSVGGSGIRPISEDEALAWCERNEVEIQVVEQHFAVEEA